MRLTRTDVSKTVWIAALACSIMPAPSAVASTLWASPGLGIWLREVDVATGALGPDAAPSPNAFFADLAAARHLHGGLVWGVSTDNSGVNRLHALNPKGAQIVSSVTIVASGQQRISALAIDPVTGEFYGASSTSLYRIAPATGPSNWSARLA